MKRPNVKIYTCHLEGETFKGTAKYIVSALESIAYRLLREEQLSKAHNYFQHADHYKRVENE